MLVIDISESMQIEDFTPNRLESAKSVAKDFIDGRFQDRIGLVVFSGESYSRCPLTSDYSLLKKYIVINQSLRQRFVSLVRQSCGGASHRSWAHIAPL